MKILVFGHGQLASFLKEFSPAVVSSDADITDARLVEKEIADFGAEAVINTAAKTGVDWCQENPVEAFRVNTLAAYNLQQICRQRGVFYCQIGSGCIYYEPTGQRLIAENERPNPKSIYAFTKVWAEELLEEKPDLLILRPRLFISAKPSPKNLITRWLTMTHFITNLNSQTIIEDAVPVMLEMIRRRISGTFNFVNEGATSDYECALILKEEIDPRMEVEKTNIEELNQRLKVSRASVVLGTAKLKSLGLKLPDFKSSFLRIVEKYKRNKES